mmetsp:Transcript_77082/g.213016  ORF Transcript_77082/g.213016 Transcript_77082/m.213016 type:complete len:444 (-) Transcript_77082:324-1655(-)
MRGHLPRAGEGPNLNRCKYSSCLARTFRTLSKTSAKAFNSACNCRHVFNDPRGIFSSPPSSIAGRAALPCAASGVAAGAPPATLLSPVAGTSVSSPLRAESGGLGSPSLLKASETSLGLLERALSGPAALRAPSSGRSAARTGGSRASGPAGDLGEARDPPDAAEPGDGGVAAVPDGPAASSQGLPELLLARLSCLEAARGRFAPASSSEPAEERLLGLVPAPGSGGPRALCSSASRSASSAPTALPLSPETSTLASPFSTAPSFGVVGRLCPGVTDLLPASLAMASEAKLLLSSALSDSAASPAALGEMAGEAPDETVWRLAASASPPPAWLSPSSLPRDEGEPFEAAPGPFGLPGARPSGWLLPCGDSLRGDPSLAEPPFLGPALPPACDSGSESSSTPERLPRSPGNGAPSGPSRRYFLTIARYTESHGWSHRLSSVSKL